MIPTKDILPLVPTKVFKRGLIVYVPLRRGGTTESYVCPGYGWHHMRVFHESELLEMGCQQATTLLWSTTAKENQNEHT